jgi:hypothetical protein
MNIKKLFSKLPIMSQHRESMVELYKKRIVYTIPCDEILKGKKPTIKRKNGDLIITYK